MSQDVEVSAVGDRLRVLGVVEGTPGPVQVESARSTGHPLRADLDADGRFVVGDLPPGPTRLRCTDADGVRVVTPWVVL